MLDFCQDPEYQKLMSRADHLNIRNCYEKKFSVAHLSKGTKIYAKFNPKYEVDVETDVKSYTKSYSDTQDSLPLALSIYDDCANFKIQDTELYKFYMYEPFMQCVQNSNNQTPVRQRELICGDLVDVKKMMDFIELKPEVEPAKVNNDQRVEEKAWYEELWDYFFGEEETTTSGQKEG